MQCVVIIWASCYQNIPSHQGCYPSPGGGCHFDASSSNIKYSVLSGGRLFIDRMMVKSNRSHPLTPQNYHIINVSSLRKKA